MKSEKTLIAGVIGVLIVLLCCATPLLIILFGALGLGMITGYLEYVLLPFLLIFLGMIFYSYDKSAKSTGKRDSCCSKE